MSDTKFTLIIALFIICMFVFPERIKAQSAVTQIPKPDSPYIKLFSICRAMPPKDQVAQEFYRVIQTSESVKVLHIQLEALSSKSIDNLSAIDAEVYFLVLQEMIHRLVIRWPDDVEHLEATKTKVMKGYEHGKRIAGRFRGNSFVNCARFNFITQLMDNFLFKEHFSENERERIRNKYITFIERTLSGTEKTDTYPELLHSIVGQLYLDTGFYFLSDKDKAALPIEAGAKHLLCAALLSKDRRYITKWERYAFMVDKLPLTKQVEVVKRLLVHVEKSFDGKSELNESELNTYLHLLNLSGSIFTAARRGEDAVSIFSRHLKVTQQIRRKNPHDPNHEVNEALGYMLLGDAYVLAGDSKGATSAYHGALQVLESCSSNAKFMLRLQNFNIEIENRINALSLSAQ